MNRYLVVMGLTLAPENLTIALLSSFAYYTLMSELRLSFLVKLVTCLLGSVYGVFLVVIGGAIVLSLDAENSMLTLIHVAI